jgi:stage IV sporulation protein B
MKKFFVLVMLMFLCTGCSNREEKLIMVTEASFAPYEYYSDGKIVGVDVDIASEIAKEMGKKLVVKDVAFDSIIHEVKSGKAKIRCTIAGTTPKEYEIEIVKTYFQSSSSNKSMFIRVTDKELLATTGGIVQGMSGSPIIQDDYIIGAVTHVVVEDPHRGYGILIENMLEEAEN